MGKTRRHKMDLKKGDDDSKPSILYHNVIHFKKRLASKIFEADHIRNFKCKEIETDYILKFGVYEYKIDEYDVKIRKTQRTIALIKKELEKQENKSSNLTEDQIKINKTKINKPKVDMTAIEKHIENEFREEDLELSEKIARVTIVIEKNRNYVPAPYFDINHYYKECIKKSHPDVIINPTKHDEELFFNARDAYDNKDAEALESMLYLINSHREKNPENLKQRSDAELERFKELLKIRIELVDKEIEEITNSKPYTLKDFLNDKKKVNTYKEALVEKLLENESEYAAYQSDLNDLKKENNLTYKLDLSKK